MVAIFLILTYLSRNFGFGNKLLNVFSPVQKVFYNWSLTVKRMSQLGEILNENEYLKNELAKFSVDYVKLSELETENEYLKNELAYVEKKEINYLIAKVIGKQLYNDQILFIDQGSSNGLSEGMAVTVAQGVIVGKLIKVEEYRSQVQLLTDINSNLAVSLNQSKDTSGIIKGKVGNSLVMEYIPQSTEIKTDDLVITSGLENLIPYGLIVGKISSVESIVGQVFQKANIQPLVDYQSLRILTVIRN